MKLKPYNEIGDRLYALTQLYPNYDVINSNNLELKTLEYRIKGINGYQTCHFQNSEVWL